MGNMTNWSIKEWLIVITVFLIAVLLSWLSWMLLAGDFGEDAVWAGYCLLPAFLIILLIYVAAYRRGDRISPPIRRESDELKP